MSNNDRSTPSWGALDRAAKGLRDGAPPSVYSALSTSQLKRAWAAIQRGEPEPEDVAETLRAAARRMPRTEFSSLTDDQLRRELRRASEELRQEQANHWGGDE